MRLVRRFAIGVRNPHSDAKAPRRACLLALGISLSLACSGCDENECRPTFVAKNGLVGIDGGILDVPLDTSAAVVDGQGELWTVGDDELLRGGVLVRKVDARFHDVSTIEGITATLEGQQAVIHLPADAAAEAIPGAPDRSEGGAMAGTMDGLWIVLLDSLREGGGRDVSLFHRVAGVWTDEAYPGAQPTGAGIALASSGERVVVAVESDALGTWGAAERVSGAWVQYSDIATESATAAYGGDTPWLLTGVEGSQMIARHLGTCESEIGLVAPAALSRWESGVYVTGYDGDGVPMRFAVTDACESTATVLGEAQGLGYDEGIAAESGDAPVVVSQFHVDEAGSGFSDWAAVPCL